MNDHFTDHFYDKKIQKLIIIELEIPFFTKYFIIRLYKLLIYDTINDQKNKGNIWKLIWLRTYGSTQIIA